MAGVCFDKGLGGGSHVNFRALAPIKRLGVAGHVPECAGHVVDVPLGLEDGLPGVDSLLLRQLLLVLGHSIRNLVQDLQSVIADQWV